MVYMGDNLFDYDGGHPQVWLHDCLFSIRMDKMRLFLIFPRGLSTRSETNATAPSAG